jgi:hypothetical protein
MNFEEDESVCKFPLKTQIARTTRVLGAHRCTLINLDEEMDDIEKLGGMNNQLETS